jgi:rhodanese-related sulfurtransferase
VARPDLAIEPEEGARALYASLRALMRLDDAVEVWPAHIGGSLCGGAGMSKKPSSTIGFERRLNELVGIEDEQEFVRALLGEVQPQPPNFERIVELNRGPLLTEATHAEPLAAARVRELLDEGAVLLDGRAPREHDGVHVPGSINVTMIEPAVGTRAAWIAELDAPLVVLASADVEARRMAGLLAAVGFRRVEGVLAGGIAAWQEADLPIETTAAIDVPTLAERLSAGGGLLLDVREEHEWRASHVPGSIHVAYHDLRDGIPDEVRAAAGDRPLAVACSAGNRSSIASGLLRRAGVGNLEHVVDGGVRDLEQHGLELEQGD